MNFEAVRVFTWVPVQNEKAGLSGDRFSVSDSALNMALTGHNGLSQARGNGKSIILD